MVAFPTYHSTIIFIMNQFQNDNLINEQPEFTVEKLESETGLNNNQENSTDQEYETDLTQDSVKTYLSEIGKNCLKNGIKKYYTS